MFEFLSTIGSDALVVVGSGLVLAIILRFGAVIVAQLPISRTRRETIERLRPIVAGALILAYILLALRWILRSDAEFAPYAFVIVGGGVLVASWTAVRDIVEGVYLKAGRACRVGDYVQIGEVRGRIARLGFRAMWIETPLGELAILSYSHVAANLIMRSPDADTTSFHVFRAEVPSGLAVTDAKRKVREAALLCHWSSIALEPQTIVVDGGILEITVFATDSDRHGDIETRVRDALSGPHNGLPSGKTPSSNPPQARRNPQLPIPRPRT